MRNTLLSKKGVIFDIQRYSVNDGAGIRTNIFMKGCPLKCEWCHNMESQSFRIEVGYYRNSCIGCGLCVEKCPKGCHLLENGGHIFDRSHCDGCMECVQNCYAQALVAVGEVKSCEDVINLVKRDRPFYGREGGVTVTGGEPMAQFDFVYALAQLCRQEQISFIMETCGFGNTADFERIAPYCDSVLFDCKASSQRHKQLTGVEDTLILKNLAALSGMNTDIVLRCPIVDGGNLEREFLDKIAELAIKYPQISSVHLLPYHKTGLHKYERIGREKQKEYKTPDKETLEKAAEYIGRAGKIPVIY